MNDRKTQLEKPRDPDLESHENRTLQESEFFSPRRRPPYPKLVILDDGSDEDGECIRIRQEQLTIGRTQCDLEFPAEALMSSMHAKICLREVSNHHWVWVLEDCGSANGLFLRLKEFHLLPGCEFLIGGCKGIVQGQQQYRQVRTEVAPGVIPFRREATELEYGPAIRLAPYVFDIPAKSIPLRGRKLELGRAVEGDGRLVQDPFVEPRHARLTADESNAWSITDLQSLNGLWLRVASVYLSSSADFMAGEQRFRFLLPSPM